ncbi:Sua5/YciO/YrdC/YwlC family protein [Bacteroidales bacterium KA00251]|nr:Sua5/YciO/YrdC/YwlC family protein [Bacteroidales bacterium KA00251]
MAKKTNKMDPTTDQPDRSFCNSLSKEWQAAVLEAAKVVKAGGVILYPTDTIWGIGCDATNEKAVERIFTIKERPSNKAMLLLIDSDAKLPWLVKEVPSIAYDLIDSAVHPLTIIYPGARHVAPALIPEEGTLGIRITRELFSQSLCKNIGVPLVSTSANLSGHPSPRTFAEIDPEIIHRVDYVVPVRQNETAPHTPSEIIKLGVHNEVEIIRGA